MNPYMIPKIQYAVKQVSAFVAHSFADEDKQLIDRFISFFTKLGFVCETGKRPEARSISDKVLERLRKCDVFVGIFTRRQRSEDGSYPAAPWLIEEKAAAIAEDKKLLLFVEEGQGHWRASEGSGVHPVQA